VKPSTNTDARERVVLCQRTGELAEFVPLLDELGMAVECHEGELPSAAQVAGARIVIVAGKRLAEGRASELSRWPRTFAVVDDGAKTLSAHLNRIGVAVVVRRPIHPRALRLLLLHALYRGPERRAKKRVLIGHPIRIGTGLFKQNATLLELSRTGARIALANPPKVGSVIQLVLDKDLTKTRPMKLQAKVVRSIRPPGAEGRAEGEVGLSLLESTEYARPIQAILDRFALGPAALSSGSRPAAEAPTTAAPARAAGAKPPAPGPTPISVKPGLSKAAAPPPTPAAPTARPGQPAPTSTATSAATGATSRAPAASSPPAEPRRLPPSYQPEPAGIATAPACGAAKPIAATATAPTSTPTPTPTTPTTPMTATTPCAELESFGPDLDLFDDDGMDDFELEVDDEDGEQICGGAGDGASDSNERRRSARVAYAQRIVALDQQAARVVVGRDLCLGGMRIAANAELAVGDVLRLALHAGSETEPLVVLAGVERDDGDDGLVLAFAELTPGQRQRLEKIIAASGAIEGLRDPGKDGEDDFEVGALVVGELLGRVSPPRPAPTAGFTLIELMIVVAIIGLLCSIAIPQFGRYQMRSKTSEVRANLGAIRVVQEAYYAEHGLYVPAAAEPPMIPGPTPAPFDIATTGYAEIGWSPDGRVYFSYAIEVAPDATGYTADAAADIDGDGILQLWGYSKPDPLGALTPGGLGCDPALLDPEVVGSCTVGSSTF